MTNKGRGVTIIRWTARILGICIFLLWGAFFIEHLVEWFIVPLSQSQVAPWHIWLGQIFHFIMLAGFIVALKWEFSGSMLIIIGAFALFVDKAGSRFLSYFTVTIIPAIMYLFCWWKTRKLSAS